MTFERKPVLVVVAILAGLAACESRPAGAGTGPPPAPLLQVSGNDIVSSWANVSLWRDGVAVADATVVVNGTLIPPVALEAGRYSGALPAVLPAGEPIVLEVTSGDSRVTGVGKIPYTPVLTAAYTAAAIASDGDIAVTWTSPSDPDYFTVSAEWSCGPSCGAGTGFETAGSARALTIPAASLPSGVEISLIVFAYVDGTFSGDYRPYVPYPGMNIRNESNPVTIRR